MGITASALQLVDLEVLQQQLQPEQSVPTSQRTVGYPLDTNRVHLKSLLLKAKNKQFTLLKEIMERIFGCSSEIFLDYLYTVQKAPYTRLLRNVFGILRKHADNQPLLQLYLLANGIYNRRTDFPISEKAHTLHDLIFSPSPLDPELLLRKLGKWNTPKANIIFELLILIRRTHGKSSTFTKADLKSHRLQSPQLEYTSLLHMEGALYRKFFQPLFYQLRQKGVAVFLRTNDTYRTSDYINRRLNTIGGLLRELVLCYYPLAKQRGEKHLQVVHNDYVELDFVDTVRPLFHYLIYLTKNEHSDYKVTQLARKLFYLCMPYLNSLYTGEANQNLVDPKSRHPSSDSDCNTKHLRDAEDLVALVHQVASDVPSVKINLPPPQYVNHDPQSVLRQTRRDELRTRIGTQIHNRLLRSFPTVHNLTYPVGSFKHEQDTSFLIATEVPIRTSSQSGQIDLLVLVKHPSFNKWKPALILELKTRTRIHTLDRKEKIYKYSRQQWEQQLHLYPRSSDLQQLGTYREMLAETFDLSDNDKQAIRQAVLIMDAGERLHLDAIQSSLVAWIQGEMQQKHIVSTTEWYQLGRMNADLVLLSGTYPSWSWTEDEPDNYNLIETLEDKVPEDFHPFHHATDIYCDTYTYSTGSLGNVWQQRLILLERLLHEKKVLIIVPTLAIRDRLVSKATHNHLWTTHLTEELIDSWQSARTRKQRVVIFFDFDHLEEQDTHLLSLLQAPIIRFRDLRRSATYSMEYDTYCLQPQFDRQSQAEILPQKQLFIVPPPRYYNVSRLDLNAHRFLVVQERGSAPKCTTISLPTTLSSFQRPPTSPEVALDLLAPYSLNILDHRSIAPVHVDAFNLPPIKETKTSIQHEEEPPEHRIYRSTEVRSTLSTTYPTPIKSVPDFLDISSILEKEKIRIREMQRSYDQAFPDLSYLYSLENVTSYQAFDQARRAWLESTFIDLDLPEWTIQVIEWLGVNYYPFLQSFSDLRGSIDSELYGVALEVLTTDLLDHLGVSLRYSFVRNHISLTYQIQDALEKTYDEPTLIAGKQNILTLVPLILPPTDDFSYHAETYTYWYLNVPLPDIYQLKGSLDFSKERITLYPAKRYLQIAIAETINIHNEPPTPFLLPALQTSENNYYVEYGDYSFSLKVYPRSMRFIATRIHHMPDYHLLPISWDEYRAFLASRRAETSIKVVVNVTHKGNHYLVQLEDYTSLTLSTPRQVVYLLRRNEFSRKNLTLYWQKNHIGYQEKTLVLKSFVDDIELPLFQVPEDLEEVSATQQTVTYDGKTFTIKISLVERSDLSLYIVHGSAEKIMQALEDDLFDHPYYIEPDNTTFVPALGTPQGRIFQAGENFEIFRPLLPARTLQYHEEPYHAGELYYDLDTYSVWLVTQEIAVRGTNYATETEYLAQNSNPQSILEFIQEQPTSGNELFGYNFSEDSEYVIRKVMKELEGKLEELIETSEADYHFRSASLEVEWGEFIDDWGEEAESGDIVVRYVIEPKEHWMNTIYGTFSFAEYYGVEDRVDTHDLINWLLDLIQTGIDAWGQILEEIKQRYEDVDISDSKDIAEELYSEGFELMSELLGDANQDIQIESVKSLISFTVDSYANDYLFAKEPDDSLHLFSIEAILNITKLMFGHIWFEAFLNEVWSDSNGDDVDVFFIYDLLGFSLQFQEKNVEARRYFIQSLKLRKKYSRDIFVGLSLFNLGNYYFQQGKTDLAINCYNKVSSTNSSYHVQSSSQYNLAIIFSESNLNTAVKYLNSAIKLAEKISSKRTRENRIKTFKEYLAYLQR